MGLARWAEDWRRATGSPWAAALAAVALAVRAVVETTAGNWVNAALAASGVLYCAVAAGALRAHPVTPAKNAHYRR